MTRTRFGTSVAVAASAVLTLLLAAIGPGCGPGPADVDQAALYTPESLAAELAFRFRGLSPAEKEASAKAKLKPSTDKRDPERRALAEQGKSKGAGGGAAKKKSAAAPSVDDLVEDIDLKLNLIKGGSRADTCRKIIDTISGDSSLSQEDKKALTELVGRLAQ